MMFQLMARANLLLLALVCAWCRSGCEANEQSFARPNQRKLVTLEAEDTNSSWQGNSIESRIQPKKMNLNTTQTNVLIQQQQPAFQQPNYGESSRFDALGQPVSYSDGDEIRANGSAILEDLVNQFLEKSKEAVRQSGEQTLSSEDEHSMQMVEPSSDNEAPTTASTPLPFMQLVALSSPSPMNSPLGSEEHFIFGSGEDHEQSSGQEIDDGHIHYDMVQPQAVPSQRLYIRQPSRQMENLPQTYKNSAIGQENGTSDLIDSLGLDSSPALKIYTKSWPAQNDSNLHESPIEQSTVGNSDVTNLTLSEALATRFQAPDQHLTNSSSRSGSIQARSMNSKASQLSRPPYATHDQFHHRAEAQSANQEAELSSRIAAQTRSGGSAQSTNRATPTSVFNSSDQASSQTNASNSILSDAAVIVNSVNRISSHLAQVAANRSEQVSSPAKNPPREPQTEDTKQLQKLSSVNQLVDLSPIPASDQFQLASGSSSYRGPLVHTKEPDQSQNRLFLPRENQMFAFPTHQVNLEQNDRYSSGLDQGSGGQHGASELAASSQMYPDLLSNPTKQSEIMEGIRSEHTMPANSSRFPHNSRHGVPDSRYSEAVPGNLNRKTLESVSNQLQQQHQAEHSTSNQNLLPENDFQDHHSAELAHRSGVGSKHHAASFINITAPMVLPLSASEAMESSLGEQASRGLMAQASGFMRTTSGQELRGTTERPQLERQNQQHHKQNQAPTSSLPGSQLPSIYSQPANRFSPKPIISQLLEQATTESSLSSSTASSSERDKMRLDAPTRGPSYLSQNLSQIHQASGFRSPLLSLYSQQSATSLTPSSQPEWLASGGEQQPTNFLGPSLASTHSSGPNPSPTFSQSSQLDSHPTHSPSTTVPATISNPSGAQTHSRPSGPNLATFKPANSTTSFPQNSSTNGFITGSVTNTTQTEGDSSGLNRRVFNLTRVEHISAECSNDLIRTVIVFNGTFKGIIYSAGYVRDPNCLYINGTGKTRYDFSIRLNQCGTLGRQELHPPSGPNEVRRRDQVMWNTLSIQYNPIIEQEWDEHFRVSCEYGSDFWKTVSFSPFNVETNTGSPVVFTVDPPQCQMEILRGHGMVGPRQEAVSGPVTVGDPLTLLIHMKSEKGYDILVKNCIAHNGGNQKMQLIDSNGCVVNERFISPFRGTYNDNDLKHITLYSYLKAFRFTGSPVLYLECEIHMCQSACPPQMCYWRRLSKRYASNDTILEDQRTNYGEIPDPIGDSSYVTTTTAMYYPDSGTPPSSETSRQRSGRQSRKLDSTRDLESGREIGDRNARRASSAVQRPQTGQLSDSVSLFQALEVRQEREPDAAPYSSYLESGLDQADASDTIGSKSNSNLCYRRAEVLAFFITTFSVLLVAISVTIGCCWRTATIRMRDRKRLAASVTCANLSNSPLPSSRSDSLLSGGYQQQVGSIHHQKGPSLLRPMLHHSTRYKDGPLMPDY